MILGSKGQGLGVGAILIFIFAMILFFVVGLVNVFTGEVFDEVNSVVQADSTANQLSKDTFQDLNDRNPGYQDGLFGLFFGLLWIGMLIGAFTSDSHPVFFAVMIILLILLMFIGGSLKEGYEATIAGNAFADNYPITNFVMGNLIISCMAMFASLITVFFIKGRSVG